MTPLAGAPMTRRSLILAVAALLAGFAAPARADVPVHLRVVKGSRQGPAQMDPRLDAALKRQLSPLAYVRWEQLEEKRTTLARGKPDFLTLPGGDVVAITVQEERGGTVMFEVAIASRNAQSRLTIEKGQRIVHQVTGEKDGAATFLTLAAWP